MVQQNCETEIKIFLIEGTHKTFDSKKREESKGEPIWEIFKLQPSLMTTSLGPS